MAYETLIVETSDDIAVIRLNRPDALNALNPKLLGELCTALEEADAIRQGALHRRDRIGKGLCRRGRYHARWPTRPLSR